MSLDQENIPEQPETQQPVPPEIEPKNKLADGVAKKAILFTLNLVIAALLVLTGYFSHKFLDRYFPKNRPKQVQQQAIQQPQRTEQKIEQTTEQKSGPQPLTKIVQVDIQNGSGEKGIASRFTNFLRARGYDVVEAKNYKVSNVPRTLIVDRLGNIQTAHDLAEHIGVADTNIIQQLNPDYFVDVSIVIGQDCYELLPSKESK